LLVLYGKNIVDADMVDADIVDADIVDANSLTK